MNAAGALKNVNESKARWDACCVELAEKYCNRYAHLVSAVAVMSMNFSEALQHAHCLEEETVMGMGEDFSRANAILVTLALIGLREGGHKVPADIEMLAEDAKTLARTIDPGFAVVTGPDGKPLQ